MDTAITSPSPLDKLDAVGADVIERTRAASTRIEKLRDSFGLLSPTDLATLIGRDERTLAVWRSQKRGPDWVALGRSIFYTKVAIESWVSMNVILADRVATGSGE
jgi:hypothetical protein